MNFVIASGGGFVPRGPLPGQSPGPAGDLKRSPDPSPTFVPLTQNPGSVPGVLKILHWNFSCNWQIKFCQHFYDFNRRSAYVDILRNKTERSILCKIRLSAHNLAIERGRHLGFGSVPGVLKILHWNFSCNWNIFQIQTRNDSFSTSLILHIVHWTSINKMEICFKTNFTTI
jgi:hypothetical protein